MDALSYYLPGTADNLLFLTLAVLVLLMITGIYGYLNGHAHAQMATRPQLRWGWPALALFALIVFFFWFGQPLSDVSSSQFQKLLTLISPFAVGLIVIGCGAAAVLSSDLKWSVTAATISFLSSGLLFLQAEMLPVVLLCWLIPGGMTFLFLYHGISVLDTHADEFEEETPFREPFLSCLACGLLLCGLLWVVFRVWGPTSSQTATTSATSPRKPVESLLLVQQFLTEHWPTCILLLIFVAVSFAGITRLTSDRRTTEWMNSDEYGAPR
tara:strand:- start:139232 stop:140038 length:807 start_codon:yes stop_codon:yes gene_type:complete